MKYSKLEAKKGVAGLNVLLSLVAMLFLIGIIVMVFVVAGARLEESVEKRSGSTSVVNETITPTSTWVDLTAQSLVRDCQATVSVVYNATGVTAGGLVISSGNYSVTECKILNLTTSTLGAENWNITYTYTGESMGSAIDVINSTYTSLDDVTDWFPTFIVLGAMVVLILLVVIIINSIRSSGITEGA